MGVSDTDEALVQKAQAGDPTAFEQLIVRHAGAMQALLRRLAEPGEADDLWQEAVLLAWRDRHRLRRPDRERTWLVAIVRNRCRDAQQATNRRPAAVAEPGELVETAWGRRRARLVEEVHDAVETLPEPERDAVEAYYFDGYSIAEIAARTRCPAGTIKRRLYTARERLRHYFGVTGDDHAT